MDLQFYYTSTPVPPLQPAPGVAPIARKPWPWTESEGVKVAIGWGEVGESVFVQGSWDNWHSRWPMDRVGKELKERRLVKPLLPGVYHYCFVVDGELEYNPGIPTVLDYHGILGHRLTVIENVTEDVESSSEFDLPSSPDSTYGQQPYEDFDEEPPIEPPQLSHARLEMQDPDEDSQEPPQHVLNHVFAQMGSADNENMVALSITSRFRDRYATTTLYKSL